MTDALIEVEVVYATSERQARYALRMKPGATLDEAIRASGVLQAFPEIDLARNRVGIFGSLAKGTQVLRSGDRIEIYRPLGADPKDARRKRARGPR